MAETIQISIEDELETIRLQEAELNRKKLELLDKQREIARLAALEKEIIAEFGLSADDKMVTVKLSEYRIDIIKALSDIPTRYYQHQSQTNLFLITHYELIESKLKECKNVTIKLDDKISQRIHDLLFAPGYTVGMDGKTFNIKLSPKVNYHALTSTILSTTVKNNIYSVPLVEGWRLSLFLHGKDVVYADGVEEFIAEQVKRRNELGELKLLEDTEYDVDIGDYQLTGRQKVGAKFIEHAGSCILADPMGAGKSIQSLAPAIKNGERVLILCPAQLVLNWMYEIRKYTGENPYIMSGTEPKPFHYIDLLTEKKQYNIINYEAIAKLIEIDESYIDEQNIKHEVIKEKWLWIELLKQSKFDRIIVDEAHYIKNIDSLRSRATRALIQMTA